METLSVQAWAALAFAVGALLSGLIVWLISRQKLAERAGELILERERSARGLAAETRVSELETVEDDLRVRLAGLEAQQIEERKHGEEKLRILADAQATLAREFAVLSAEALKKNNESFLDLARVKLEEFQTGAKADLQKRQLAIDQMVEPVKKSLEQFGLKIGDIEKQRIDAYSGIKAQLAMMAESQSQLRGETANLVKALRSPVARGRWGEIQLRRVVEMAGMLEHCDFFEQASVTTEAGRLRPDLLVRLPAGKNIVVDAKAPLEAYLEALEAPDEVTKKQKLIAHAAQVRAHIDALTRKAYWEQFSPAPEFVVLFLPGETFFSAALEHDPGLIEHGADRRVILATPTTLIALLRAVFYGWRQERLAENAEKISALGRDLYVRLSTLGRHFDKVGKHLSKAVETYNSAASSLESRVMVTARQFKDLEAAPQDGEIDEITQIDHVARQLQSPELKDSSPLEE